MRRTIHAIAILALAAALFAGCGGGGESSEGGYGPTGGSSTASRPPSPSSGEGAIVSVTSVPGLGRVLVSSKGLTLYDFRRDKGGKSACYGACAQVWPPLTTGAAPQPSNGVVVAKLGTTRRKDGTVQVTYAGHPLYLYAADTKPGDAKGNDIDSFGGQWYALQPSGEEAGG
ncbi:MAG TPA: hypothetical protein VG518_05960 [Solirubrobacterales bacterium]|nr:hypothetical protein [Solirubrobacterales bacterium]